MGSSFGRNALMRGLAVLLFIFSVLIGVHEYRRERERLEGEWRHLLKWSTSQIETRLLDYLKRAETKIEAFSRSSELVDGIMKNRGLPSLLSDFVNSNPGIKGAYLLTLSYRIYRGAGIRLNEYFPREHVQEGKSGFSGYVTAKEGLPYLSFLFPVRRAGTIISYLYVLVSLEPVNNIIKSSTGIARTHKVYITNENGLIVAYAPEMPDEGLMKFKVDLPRMLGATSKEGIGLYSDFKGVEVLGAVLPLNTYGYLVSEIRYDEVIEPLNYLFLREIAFLVVLVILLVILFLQETHELKLPQVLREGLSSVLEGKPRTLPPVEGELGIIPRAINLLLGRVRDLEEMVKKMEEERKGVELGGLIELSRGIMFVGSKNEIGEKILYPIKEILGFDTVALRLYNPRIGEFEESFVVGLDESGQDEFVRHVLSKSVLEDVVASERIRIVTNLVTERLLSQDARRTLMTNGIVQLALIPLLSRRGILGVLVLGSKKELDWGSLNDILKVLSREVASAVERIALNEEISELRQQLALRQAELRNLLTQLEATGRSKSYFLAAVSHELRAPLNAILGFSDLLLSGNYGELTEEQKKSIENIHEAGKHLLELINDILDLARIEAGREELKIENIDVRSMLERILLIVKGQATKKGLNIYLEVAPELKYIQADQKKFKQIMFNLLSNAIKFTPEGGKIFIRAWKMGNQAFFSVRDTGIGIRKEDLERIFEPFVQVDEGLAKRYGGAGLGLTLVREYVRMHGGEVWAESEGPSKGATFTFVLPLREELMEEKPKEEEKPQRGNVVLVIEEDVIQAELLKKIIESQGVPVVLARDGEEGLKLAREVNPSVIIMDLVLPGIDGFKLLDELKDDERTRHIPIIVTSILSEERRAKEKGVSHYLIKPVDREELLGVLKEMGVLEGGRRDRDERENRVIVPKVEGYERMVETLKGMGFSVKVVEEEELDKLKEDGVPVIKTWRDLNKLFPSTGNNRTDREDFWWHPKTWREIEY